MRVCILGDITPPIDEGMKRVTLEIAHAMQAHAKVKVLNPLDAMRSGLWRTLVSYRPHVVHYVPGPSIKSFILLWLTKRVTSALSVMSITHPSPNLPRKLMCSLFRPDVLITQSSGWGDLFRAHGCQIELIPNGVQLDKFIPVGQEAKRNIRKFFGLPENDFLILHIGNLKIERNLRVLSDLSKSGFLTLVVASTSVSEDATVRRSVEESGCIVMRSYVPNIEEIYAMADCYVFPTREEIGAIELPLSVLEAMACNLPVVTTRFGAIEDHFSEGDGLFYANSDDEFIKIVSQIAQDNISWHTRDKVISMDWDAIGYKLFKVYEEAIVR